MSNSSLVTGFFKSSINPCVLSQAGWALFRVGVSLMMVHNGLDKLEDIEGFASAYVEVIGLPFPVFFAYIAALTELLAAPMLALGFFSRLSALGLFSTMAVAMYHHILVAGFSIPYLELSAVYASCFLFFVLNGGGLYSVDALILSVVDGEALSDQARKVMRLAGNAVSSDVAESAA